MSINGFEGGQMPLYRRLPKRGFKNPFKTKIQLISFTMINSLIKKYKPRYNVLLKDDKTFPWICLKKNPFPKVFPTRKVIKDGSIYFGPYPNVKTVYTLLDLIKEITSDLNFMLSCISFLLRSMNLYFNLISSG